MLKPLAAVLVTVAIVATACSSSTTTSPATAAPTSPSPSTLSAADYVAGVCSAMGQYQTDVQKQQASFNPNTTDLAQLKQNWLDFLQGMLTATQTLVSSIDALGVPDTSDGQQAAATLKKDFQTLQADLQKLIDQSQSLSASDPSGFMAQLQPMLTSFQTDMQGFGQDLQQFNGGPLDQAFSQAPECQSLVASASPSA